MATWKPWDKIVVINLNSRIDRWEQLQTEIAKSRLLSAIPVTRFSALDPSSVARPSWFTAQENADGEFCCRESHLRVLNDAILDGTDHLLKLEDDFEIGAEFDERLSEFFGQMPENFMGYQLSGLDNLQLEMIEGSPACARNRGSWCTDMIGLSKSGIRRLYDHITWHRTVDIDRVHQSLTREEPHFYRPVAFFAQQRESYSDLRRKIANLGRPPL
jgi:GR25 family glycosyltransferase involved in LPS biosynthesis